MTIDLAAQRAGPSFGDRLVFLVATTLLTACLTVVFLAMRAVMEIGGSCAEGGPYVVARPCPDGVPALMSLAFPAMFLFGGVMLWKGSRIGPRYAGLVALAWPALFLSLGWNFLEYAVRPPDGSGDVVLGWLIPGVLFVLMGGLPLIGILGLARGNDESASRASRQRFQAAIARSRRRMASAASEEAPNDPQPTSMPGSPTDLVAELERLAALWRSGALTDQEFQDAKRRLLGPGA